jgi:hypothetical protein
MLNKILCFFLGHQWINIATYTKKRRQCGRCDKKQVYGIKFDYRGYSYETWI